MTNGMMHDHEAWFAPGGADGVRGFLSPISADAISRLLSDQRARAVVGNLVEIGTYMGRTFVGLAKASREGERVIGFDLFPPAVETGFREAIARLPEELRARITAIRRDTRTLTVAQWLGSLGGPARFVHVDGGHSYETIVNDLQLAAAHLTADAVVVLDDFLHDWYPDLTEGMIDALRASRLLVPVAVMPRNGPIREGGSKLVCATREAAGHYRRLLTDAYHDRQPQARRLAGHEVMVFQGF